MLVQINIITNKYKFLLLLLEPFLFYLVCSNNYFSKVENLINLSEKQTRFANIGEEIPQPFNTNLDKTTKESLDKDSRMNQIEKEKIIEEDRKTKKYYLSYLNFYKYKIQLEFPQGTLETSIPRSPPSASC